MRKFLILLLFSCLLNDVSYCQEKGTVLRGIITRHSSGGIPVKGVTITAEDANATVSKNSGRFEMTFIKKKIPGNTVYLTVFKEGWEVVNRHVLEYTFKTDSEKLLEIFICKQGERDKHARFIYGIGENGISKNFFREELKKTKKEIKDKIDAALSVTKESSQTLARVNLDEAPELFKKAFASLKQGNIEQTLELLDDEKIKEDFRTEQKKWTANYNILKAHAFIIDLNFDLAETCYQKAIQADPDNFEIIANYADFLYFQNKFSDSLPEYEKALFLAKKKSQKAEIHNKLGNLYRETTRFDKALAAFTKALNLRRELASKNKNEYLPDVARTLCDLGAVYSDIKRTDEAMDKYKYALDIYKELQIEKPNAYLADEAFALNGLGLLYLDIPEFASTTKPLKAFKKALQNYEKLATENQDTYYSAYEAMVLTNMATYYAQNELFKDAEKAYNKALTIRIKLEKKNPNNLPYVANIRVNLGFLYCYIDNCSKTEENYDKALKIYRELAVENPNAYKQEVAWTLCHLGNFYRYTSRFSEASDAYKEALDIREQLAKENPENPTSFELDVTNTLIAMGYLYQALLEKENKEFYKNEGLCLVKRAITILKKYPDIPQAISNMEKARELLDYFEK